MDFYEVLEKVIELLQRHGRVTYRALKLQFKLDDETLEALKEELLYAHPVVDDEGRGLVWTGDAAPEPAPTTDETKQRHDPTSYTPLHLAEKILTSRSALEGERKQVTVMFADIKDSTELIRDLDPEAAQQLLDPAIHIMMDAVHRFEGTVNQVLGDGIMAIFGAPVAHEDHAARACYAALSMQAAMKPYADEIFRSHAITMQIRVGLNSGEVVVRTIGNDLHMDYSAVGQTTNLASRMEQLATPGSITLTDATLRLVEGLVSVNTRGSVPVKGITESVEVYELTGASSVRRRLQASISRGLTKFVGRDTEIEALNQALEKAKAGNGQVVAAVGEAGLGKSRLFYEFTQSHRTQGWRVLESASVSYGKATPYFPVVDLLKRYAHVEDSDDARTMRAKLTGQVLTLDEALHEVTPALLALCDVLPDAHPFSQLDPPQRRQRTLDGLKRILLRESQVQPLLLVFEDLHWIDSETQALLDSLVESLPTAQILLLVNYRPEYQHGWGGKTYYTQLRLDPLPPESADAFLATLLGDDSSLESLKKLLIERTRGNPFFLEESVRTMVETQVLVGESGTYRLAQELPTIQVPATVQAILAARIDRLAEDEKQLLQTASVIGNEVPWSLLQTVSEISVDTLHRSLTHLQAAEFLYETNLYPERVYTFKHALTHEVAYGSLLQERRRILHARIVEALEALSADQVAEQVERLAHHAFRGELWDKAFTYLWQGGNKARARSANWEAVTCFEQALEAVQHLPADHDTMEQAIDLRFDLRTALFMLGEHERMVEHLRDAEVLAETLGDQPRLGQITYYMSLYFLSMGDEDRSLAASQHCLRIAESAGDVGLQATTRLNLGRIYHYWGDYAQAIDVLEQNITFLTGERLYEYFGIPGPLSVMCRSWVAWCRAEMGDFAEALRRAEEGIQIAEMVDEPFSLIRAYNGIGWAYVLQGELSVALPPLESALRICHAANQRNLLPFASLILGEARTLSGQIADALPLLEQAVELTASIGRNAYARALIGLAEVYLLDGRAQSATDCAMQALDHCRAHKQRGNQAHALRLLGDIAMHRHLPEFKQAETHYQQALTLATELGMRPLQTHCHRGLGTLYSQTGQPEQARVELSTAIEMYRDMEMAFWLPETEAALTDVEGKA